MRHLLLPIALLASAWLSPACAAAPPSQAEMAPGAAGAVTAMRFFPDGDGAGIVVARSAEPLPAERASIRLSQAQLARLAGTYVGPDALRMKVFIEGERLQMQLAGQPASELFAESATRCFLKEVDATLEFASDASAAQALTLHQGPLHLAFKRVAE